MSVLIVYCTCPDPETASSLARQLVDERLAACVSRLPAVESCYRWQGRVEGAREELLMIKTTPGRLPALEQRLHELHPYEVPEFLVVPAQASQAYADWVADQVAP